MKLIVILLTLLSIGLLFFVSQSQATDQLDKAEILETLYALEIKKDKLHVKMLSTGCSKVEDFKLTWSENNELAIYRLKPDNCRRVPMKKWFVFDISKQYKAFKVQNNFSDK